jgi:hypothetical protein
LREKKYITNLLQKDIIQEGVGGLWCLTPLSTTFQFYWWRNWRNQRKPPTCHKSLTKSHNVVSSTPRMSEIRTHNVSGDRH